MVPAGWVRRSVAPDSHVLPLRIALRQAGMDELLSEHLLAVSDPENERYGQHLSQQEVNAFLAPSQQSEEAVRRWLVEHGIEEHQHKRSVAGDWISVNVSVRKAREMLGGADFAMYQNERSGEMLVRTTEYSLPDELHR